MSNSTKWLKISLWTGAIVDGIVALIMFAQMIFSMPSPITQYIPEIPYRYAMGLAGSLMLGWTFLLLWALRDPVYRRGVILITVLVLIGLILSNLFAYHFHFISLNTCLILVLFQLGLIALFALSYLNSKMNRSCG